MNKVYNIIWNAALGLWVVASELSKGKKKSSSRKTGLRIVSGLFAGATLTAIAAPLVTTGTHIITDDYPDVISAGVHQDVFNYGFLYENHTSGDVLTITGAIPSIAYGQTGIVESSTIRDLLAEGKITLTATNLAHEQKSITTIEELAEYLSHTQSSTPSQSVDFQVIDPADPEKTSTLKVFDTASLASFISVSQIGDAVLNTFDANVSQIYKQFGFALAKNGSTANLNIGDNTLTVRENDIRLLAKDSSLLKAQEPNSKVNWQSDNYIQFGAAPVVPTKTYAGSKQTTVFGDDITLMTYGYDEEGKVVETGNRTFSIKNTADLANFNNWLIGAGNESAKTPDGENISQIQLWLDSGAISKVSDAQTYYASLINQLLTSSTNADLLTWDYDVWTDGLAHTNNATAGTGELHAIYANGQDTTGTLAQGAILAVDGSINGAMKADGGGSVLNEGALNVLRTSTGQGLAIGMLASDASATNRGTINSGLFIDKDGNQNVNSYGAYGMQGLGNSTVVNEGTINQAITTNNYGTAAAADPWSTDKPNSSLTLAIGMQLSGETSGTNKGEINVVDGRRNGDSFGKGTAYGVEVSGDATFTNTADGTIYLGRNANNPAEDIAMGGGASPSAGILTRSTDDVTNDGTITLGKGVRNAAGMLVGNASGNVINTGKITLNGDSSSGTSQNFGISVRDSGSENGQQIRNDGEISVNGHNNIGIHLSASSRNAHVTSSDTGAIAVAGDGGTSNRNYAIWAEGSTTSQAIVDVLSTITLEEIGNIGVHVRDNAIANINSTSSPLFKNSDQIGYYLYGNGATANIGKADMNDNGQARTTLFRIANGANFAGNTINPENNQSSSLEMALSGEKSIGVFATGKGSTVDTGEATFTVSGNGAAALLLEGGAEGTISDKTLIELTGSNTTAGIVDGQAHQLNGNKQNGPVETVLNSNATIRSAVDGLNVIAYVAKNLGNIVLQQDAVIDLASKNSIGVDVQEGGRLSNNSSQILHVSNGIGVRASGEDAQIKKLGTIEVDDGIAGVLLTNGATLNMTAGTGGLADTITTKGTADGIRLDAGAGSLTAKGVTISALGSGAGIQNHAESSDITLNDVTINANNGPGIRTSVALNVKDGANNVLNVTGSGSGFAFMKENGDDATGDLTIGTGYTVRVHNDAGNATGNGIDARTNGRLTTRADIIVQDATGGSAILAKDVSALTNSGSITSNSVNGPVVDASGDNGKTITNNGTILAATDRDVAIQSGKGNDTINISGGNTRGVINTGAGSDRFIWNSGTFAGEVNFAGTTNNKANIGNVSLTETRHITTLAGTGNALTFTNTTGNIGTLLADDLSLGTNIGSGWNTLTLTGAQADMRIVDSLTLTDGTLSVNNGATLRTGDHRDVSNTSATIGNYSITTSGNASNIIFDTQGNGADSQIYQGTISGSGNFVRATGGTTVFTTDNNYSGSTTINQGGALHLGQGGTTGGINPVSQIVDDGILTVNRSNSVLLNGVISGIGALEQIGKGITRLTGANRYKGETIVDNGTLLVNGNQSAATGMTTVNGMAILGGIGTLGGDVVMNDATTLSAGDGGAGTLKINGSLQLGNKTTSAFELGQAFVPGGSQNDLVDVAGNLLLDGTLNVSQSAGGAFGPGVYRLYNYGGTLNNQTLELGDVPAGQDKSNIFVQTVLDKQVNLVNANGVTLQFWDGAQTGENHGKTGIEGNGKIDGGDGKWMAIGSQGDNNWTQQDGIGNAPWAQKAFAVFTGNAGTVEVDRSAGDVQFSGAQFDADGYVIKGDALNAWATTAGSGELMLRVGSGGAGANFTATIESAIREGNSADSLTLVKTDPGRLILSGDNAYHGGTRIDGGTLQISADNNLGQAGTGVTINNGSTLQLGADFTTQRTLTLGTSGAAAVFDLNSHHFTPVGEIAGAGNLKVTSSTHDAASMLSLDRANSYQGTTLIEGTGETHNVTVNASQTGVFGSNASSTVSVTKGATLNVSGAATRLQSLTLNIADSLLTLKDTVTAAGATLNLKGKAKALIADNATAGQSTINVSEESTLALEDNASGGSATVTNSGLMSFAGHALAEMTTVINQSGGSVNVSNVDSATAIGSLSGAGNVELGDKTLSLGNLALDDTISGIISGDHGNLVKIGDGTLTLTGDNTWTGTTSVDEGILLVNGNQAAATGDVTVRADATLGGNGIIGGAVNVADNGHITAGSTLGSVGKLTTGSLTLNDLSQLDYQFGQAYTPGGAFNDLINVNGDLVLDGKLNIATSPGGSFDVGVYRVINYSGTLTNNVMDIANAPAAADSLYVQTSVKNQVNLVNHGGLTLRFWDGTGGENGELKNNGVINGGDGIWQSSHGNDNWTTDESTPEGALNAPFTDAAFAVFQGDAGNVTVDNSLGDVIISGAQFAADGYRVAGDAITTDTANTLIRVGDGTVDGASYTATIDSQIRGTGGVNKSDLGTLILTGDNHYSGGTTITAGTLQVSADKNLGAANTGITFNGGTLKYGDAFNTARQVTLESGGGTFDTNGFNVALLTEVDGSGQLTKTGQGTLMLTLDTAYTGGTHVVQGTLQLGNGGEIGSVQGDIIADGILNVKRCNNYTLSGNISGEGQFHQTGSGTTTLEGQNSYKGATLVASGVLQAGGVNTLSAASHHYVASDTALKTQGYDQTVAGLTNSGNVSLMGAAVGSALTVKGDYHGKSGTLELAAAQSNSGQGIADRLVIDGGKVSGSTLLKVDGSGLGAPTVGDGIEVVTAKNGATTTAQSTRDGFHLASNRMSAGAFEYQLYAGNAKGQGENWYLRSAYRPETMLYSGLASVVRQGDLSLLGNMHQRMGDDVRPGRDEDNRAWARMIGYSGKTKLDDVTGTQTTSHTMGIQAGVDLYADANWKAGIYTSILDIDSSVKGSNAGSAGKGGNIDDNAFYLGSYATWFSADGMYVDNVLQYGNHDARLSASGNNGSHTVKGHTLTASTEIGKAFRLGASAWSLEPQAQLIYQYSDFDDSTLGGTTKTKVKLDTADAFTARVGLRLKADYDTRHGKIQPYGRVNLWQGLGSKDKTHFSNAVATTTLESSQQYSSTEVAAGLSWNIDRDLQVYGELGTQFNNGGHKSQVEAPINASIGFKKSF
ncbi:TPA: autotransporter outer membrane beta-barrel domain-containing protein [Citrobacter farmeri]|uniref:Autotransporter outer membrane beta-barrel domain-containing protein n=1 Tax=Citrobacter farmeri TaxID=67824 RepID=A0ACA8D3T7_9ENTR|nr:autotransporter outer membrane beta-barrel domain-containing protein [Citrobacter farmeri]AST78865.1 autotransporter outer membrane beta-barrel domain-containing protein [Citrobacter farmeri]HAT2751963.1 autotransporter outer membrane beta-barrel domain-containing protein [Citrobacter farmeri]HBI2992235.1 autotransporter outer membrane beta-barrel domain-containing protein [Citrobacter farmeri]HBI3000492.1 autotransporter outer membrane beta-barrel domain-containing protein [Citrobacter farm